MQNKFEREGKEFLERFSLPFLVTYTIGETKKMMSKLLSSSHSNANTTSSSSRYKNVTDVFSQSQLLTLNGYLPEHLVAEILYRLRVKELLRFRCVSKPWCALIDSPHFVKTHLKRSIQCNTNAAVVWMDYRSYAVDFDSLENVTAIRTAEPLKTRLYAAALVGSCNGLHCLFNPKGDVFLWNPVIRKCRKLPTAPIDFRRTNGFGLSSVCGFGYDAVNDDYKVLSIFRPEGHTLAGSEVIIYCLKTNSWRWLQNISSHFQFVGVYGMFVSGALHWIAIKTLDLGSCLSLSLSILAFDLGIENYREVSMPEVQYCNVEDLSIVIFADSLCILEDHPGICTNIWVMKDYGVGNSWCKLFSVGQSKVNRSVESTRPVRPVTYSKSGKDVLLEVDKEKLMWYNLETKKVKTVKVGNIRGVFDLEVYTESLVPPDYNFSCPLQKQPQEKKTQQQQQKNERHKFVSKGFKLVL
ncbi:F-box domain-containing protein [Heracleum sosnowskyi]|uniref:F-box domain-containing protein n=1 Tax=Heracleum sosnowskyi TaxID=360622 RepID=A0AAD8M9H0_9APIA|nr:F-box domain-containing protein [Heracleum sosnowskyi]